MPDPIVRKTFNLPWTLAEAFEQVAKNESSQNALAVKALSEYPPIARILSEGLK